MRGSGRERGGRWPRTVTLLVRLVLGGVFLYASVDKVLHPADFAEAVYNYQILPEGLINLAALVLPWLELLIGLCLVAGVWLPGAALLSTLLMAVFIGALVYNLARGLDIHCGCFSAKAEATEGSMVWYLFRDGLFLVMSGYLLAALTFFRLRSAQTER